MGLKAVYACDLCGVEAISGTINVPALWHEITLEIRFRGNDGTRLEKLYQCALVCSPGCREQWLLKHAPDAKPEVD